MAMKQSSLRKSTPHPNQAPASSSVISKSHSSLTLKSSLARLEYSPRDLSSISTDASTVEFNGWMSPNDSSTSSSDDSAKLYFRDVLKRNRKKQFSTENLNELSGSSTDESAPRHQATKSSPRAKRLKKSAQMLSPAALEAPCAPLPRNRPMRTVEPRAPSPQRPDEITETYHSRLSEVHKQMKRATGG